MVVRIVELEFEINGQIIKRLDENIIVNKSKNYIYCNFTFNTSEWFGVDKYAIFKDSWDNVYHVHLGDEDNFHILVPYDVMQGVNFRVSVYGGDLITSNQLNVILIPSGYTTKYNLPRYCQEKDIFVEIFEGLESKIDNISLVDGEIVCYSNENIVCTVPLFKWDNLKPVAFTGNYDDLINTPSIPLRTSDLINDGSNGVDKFIDDSDVRLTDAREPLAHNHNKDDIVDFNDGVAINFKLLADCIRRG